MRGNKKFKNFIYIPFVASLFWGEVGMANSNESFLDEVSVRLDSAVKDQISLSNVDAFLVKIACLSTYDSQELLTEAIEEAIVNKVSLVQIREAIIQGAPYIGVASAKKSEDLFYALLDKLNIKESIKDSKVVNDNNRFTEGVKVQKSIFGSNIDKLHQNARDDERYINVELLSAFCFGDVYTRSDLSLSQKELLTFTYIASLGAHNGQLIAHIQGNLTVGNTRANLLDALKIMTPYIGFPRTLTALAILDEQTSCK